MSDDNTHVSGIKTTLVKWDKDAAGRWSMSDVPGTCHMSLVNVSLVNMSLVNVVFLWL